MPKALDVKFCLQGAIRRDDETDCFVSYCPALDLYSAAKTRMEAKRALQGAVDLYVRLCYQREILGRVLHEKGFTLLPSNIPGNNPMAGFENYISVEETELASAYDDTFQVEVPLHLIADQQARAAACLQ